MVLQNASLFGLLGVRSPDGKFWAWIPGSNLRSRMLHNTLVKFGQLERHNDSCRWSAKFMVPTINILSREIVEVRSEINQDLDRRCTEHETSIPKFRGCASATFVVNSSYHLHWYLGLNPQIPLGHKARVTIRQTPIRGISGVEQPLPILASDAAWGCSQRNDGAPLRRQRRQCRSGLLNTVWRRLTH